MDAPGPLNETHDLDGFSCGKPVLDDWLKKRARANQFGGASRTYVVAEATKVLGYYCLASGAIAALDAPGSLRRNMPDPIPMVILGRLAVDWNMQGRGLGAALLQDAVSRTHQAAGIISARGILVLALDDAAARFYERYGFSASPTNPLTLVLSLKSFKAYY